MMYLSVPLVGIIAAALAAVSGQTAWYAPCLSLRSFDRWCWRLC
jgi:hypothetical protein